MIRLSRPVRILALALTLVPAGLAGNTGAPAAAETDLDAFMRQVLASRDENWRKLQQFVLDEREQLDLEGPGRAHLWGERRDYTWFIRDGFFVRSPVRSNGVAISDRDRRKYEDDYLRGAEARDRRGVAPAANGTTSDDASDVDGLIRQTRQPQFISSAYFLRFRFEEGTYAFAGRERLDDRDVLRIEYYPTRMFGGTDRRRGNRSSTPEARAYDAEFQRLMNKVALITLWVEPDSHQIVKYTFDNVAFDFLPARWLVHVNDVKASMTMSQPFPGVWLPRGIDLAIGLTIAVGEFDLRYALDYHDYRQADVKTKVTIPEAR